MKSIKQLFARMRQSFFHWRTNFEIHDRIFPHLLGEKDHGYSFGTDDQMDAQTAQLDVQPLLDSIEKHIQGMPEAYSRAFRHVMHRDLNERLSERLRMYERAARRAVQPKCCDPHFMATRMQPQ